MKPERSIIRIYTTHIIVLEDPKAKTYLLVQSRAPQLVVGRGSLLAISCKKEETC